mmetsp:Transcript_20499/g.32014  ORF Transcript_20499/g.32014 Transcript_20499/m.32014 type:complete len:272 (-) Transcript_20499:58-873(-)
MSLINEIIHRYDTDEKADISIISLTMEIAKAAIVREIGMLPSIDVQLKKLADNWESNYRSCNDEIIKTRLQREKEIAQAHDGDLVSFTDDVVRFPFFQAFPRIVQEEYATVKQAMNLNPQKVFQAPSRLEELAKPSDSFSRSVDIAMFQDTEVQSNKTVPPTFRATASEIEPFSPPQNVQFYVWFHANDALRKIRPFSEKRDRSLTGRRIMKSIVNFLHDQLARKRGNLSSKAFGVFELSGVGYYHARDSNNAPLSDSACHNVALRFHVSR